MPAESGKQQHFMGMVHAFQMGKLHSEDLPAGVRSKVAKAAKSMTKKASGEFAASVKENDDNIDFSVLSFKEYIMVESALVEAFSELSEDEAKVITGKLSAEDLKPAPRKAATADEYASNMAAERHARRMQAARAAKNAPSSTVTEKWAEPFEVPKSKKGMFSGKTKAELESELTKLKKSGPHHEGSPEFTKEKELNFALRAKSGWKSA